MYRNSHLCTNSQIPYKLRQAAADKQDVRKEGSNLSEEHFLARIECHVILFDLEAVGVGGKGLERNPEQL